VHVDSVAGAVQLLANLSHAFVFKSSEPMHQTNASTWYTFRVTYSSGLSFKQIVSLVGSMPGVSIQSAL
jgi:hypothetical protein